MQERAKFLTRVFLKLIRLSTIWPRGWLHMIWIKTFHSAARRKPRDFERQGQRWVVAPRVQE